MYKSASKKWNPRYKSKIKALNLRGNSINELDSAFLKFSNLEDLSLTGNILEEIKNLPNLLKVLHLNANYLDHFPNIFHLKDLEHLGLAQNRIRSLGLVAKLPSLISLDLSWNHLQDLPSTLNSLQCLSNLKTLALFGNPICLLPSYIYDCTQSIPSLKIFDEQPLSNHDLSKREFSCDGI